MIARALDNVLRGGVSLVQNVTLGSFKVRVYGSWLDGTALRSAAGSRSLVSIPLASKGLKDLATSESVRAAKQLFVTAASPSIARRLSTSLLKNSIGFSPILQRPALVKGFFPFGSTPFSKQFREQAISVQRAFCQQAILKQRTANALAKRAFSQAGASRLFSGSTRIAKKAGGEAGGEAASKATETSYPGKRFVEWYLQKIDERPLLVKSLTAGAIFVASDLCAQAIGGFYGGYDLPRSLRMAAFGLFLSGPLLHFWFGLMTRMYPGRDLISVCKKIFIGQTTVGPMFTAVFYSLNAALQGEKAEAIWARLKRDLIPTLKAGLTFWPLIDLFTYSRVPVHLMPLTNNAASFLWTIYITYIAGQGQAD